MSHEIRHARVAGPIRCGSTIDPSRVLPWGPCLLERIDGRHVDIVWGESGEFSAEVSLSEIERAADSGDLVLLN